MAKIEVKTSYSYALDGVKKLILKSPNSMDDSLVLGSIVLASVKMLALAVGGEKCAKHLRDLADQMEQDTPTGKPTALQ